MTKIENECVQCGLPCLYESCPFWAVARHYCDCCGEEADALYHWDDGELCLDCIVERLERVEFDE